MRDRELMVLTPIVLQLLLMFSISVYLLCYTSGDFMLHTNFCFAAVLYLCVEIQQLMQQKIKEN